MLKLARPFALAALPVLLACQASKVAENGPGRGGTSGNPSLPPASGNGGSMFVPPITTAPDPCPNKKCTDFPKEPIIEMGAPPDAPSQFGAAPTGAAPCLWEPEDGTVFPQKWLRPRIRWTGTTGLHRITIRSEMQERDLVAYTTGSAWVMPKDIWTALAAHVVDQDVVVTVRAQAGGEVSVKFQIAPVSATGSMIFWAVKPEEVGRGLNPANKDDVYASELRGFSIGDESTVSVLQSRQVMQTSAEENGIPRRVRCIGCHAAPPAPDNGFIAFVDDWPWNLAIAGVKPGSIGATLPGLGEGGLKTLNIPWGGMMTFSQAHWKPGRRLVVLSSSLQDYRMPWSTDARKIAKLLWYNLDAPPPPLTEAGTPGSVMPGVHFGEIARQGDSNGAGAPTWSHDGAHIVYSSTAGGNSDGALQTGATDLYKIPFNDGAGGPATPLMGAADAAFEEYYAAYSADDVLIGYTRVPRGQRMYANKLAELAVVPSGGGTPVRLAANDPPACTGKKSPGINNHWPKWSPSVPQANGKSYYWMLFSSNRADIAPVPRVHRDPAQTGEQVIQVSQLYMTLVVRDGTTYRTYPAVYLWNQPNTTLNTTPIWEDVAIPSID